MHQQCLQQQGRIEVGLAQDFLSLGEDPVLNIEDLALGAFLRQVLHDFAHVGQAEAGFVLGQLIAQDQARPIAEPIEQAQHRNVFPFFGQLRRRLLLLEEFFHPFHHLRALFTHALGLEIDRRQR
ncbi:hypothetical protein D9M73_259460 [compost metagenome]